MEDKWSIEQTPIKGVIIFSCCGITNYLARTPNGYIWLNKELIKINKLGVNEQSIIKIKEMVKACD